MDGQDGQDKRYGSEKALERVFIHRLHRLTQIKEDIFQKKNTLDYRFGTEVSKYRPYSTLGVSILLHLYLLRRGGVAFSQIFLSTH